MFKVSARTVLELGAELISSDIIAFYELIKNAIDAKSETGAEIHFFIPLRRNDYVDIRQRALAEENEKSVSELREALYRVLDVSAGSERVEEVKTLVKSAMSREEFVDGLDEAYRRLSTIEIRDTGTGMSLGELRENYLTLGTPSRKKEVDAALERGKAKTPYLGEKGIGRLSAMRLGNRLRVDTARVEDTQFNVLDIDWNLFADLDAMVEDVNIAPEIGPSKKPATWSGTTLTISDLSEQWTQAKLVELARTEFSRITDPFLDAKRRPRIGLFWNGNRVSIPWMNRALINHAHGSFKGQYLVQDGIPELRYRIDAIKLGGYEHPPEYETSTLGSSELQAMFSDPVEGIPKAALTSVGPFVFEGYWYNRRYLSSIDDMDLQEVRTLQRQWSGIMLFRDGFRVFPYGDDYDDWLGLDRRALGRPGYALNKAQFVGRVQITRTTNPGLVDQTNREGLRQTPEERVLVGVLRKVIIEDMWNFFREMDRRYRKESIDLGKLTSQVDELESRAKTALKKVRTLVPRDESDSVEALSHAFNEFSELISRAQQRINEAEAEGREMVQIAGVGLMVEVIAHELTRAAESALESLESMKARDVPTEFRPRLDTLRAEMKTVSKRLRVLDELSVSGRQRKEVFDLGQLISDVFEGHATQFSRHGISVEWKAPNSPLRVQLVKGMVVQIVENLVSNSVYWLKKRKEREAGFLPTISVQLNADPLKIVFSDNGTGIAPEHIERVFRPFWSLKERGKRRGLGLYIARENANYLGGRLYVSDKPHKETARLHDFILDLPQRSIVL